MTYHISIDSFAISTAAVHRRFEQLTLRYAILVSRVQYIPPTRRPISHRPGLLKISFLYI
jgi:hypothetical protein